MDRDNVLLKCAGVEEAILTTMGIYYLRILPYPAQVTGPILLVQDLVLEDRIHSVDNYVLNKANKEYEAYTSKKNDEPHFPARITMVLPVPCEEEWTAEWHMAVKFLAHVVFLGAYVKTRWWRFLFAPVSGCQLADCPETIIAEMLADDGLNGIHVGKVQVQVFSIRKVV
uniref:Uncharacterized protein n=1 Tax=Magallana gigas TaxID=29159 RepID=K1Q334_MAGGI